MYIEPLSSDVFTPLFSTIANNDPVNTGTLRTVDFRSIVVHHTVGSSRPSGRNYHFTVAHGNGHVNYDRNVNRQAPHAGTVRNANSVGIAAIGQWDDRVADNGMQPTGGAQSAIPNMLRNGLTNIITDCLINFRSIIRFNRCNLPLNQMQHFANSSRNSLGASMQRHSHYGILGHDDVLNAATRCPGVRLYNLLRDTIVPNAILTADFFDLIDSFRNQENFINSDDPNAIKVDFVSMTREIVDAQNCTFYQSVESLLNKLAQCNLQTNELNDKIKSLDSAMKLFASLWYDEEDQCKPDVKEWCACFTENSEASNFFVHAAQTVFKK